MSRIPRFFSPLPASDELILRDEEHQHLAKALRLAAGREVEVFDGEGRRARATVSAVEKRQSVLELTQRWDEPPRAPPWLRVAVAIPKAKRAQRLLEALTELGADEIVPLQCVRSVSSAPSAERARRWILESCKQCRRDRLPGYCAPLTPAALLEGLGDDELALVCDTGQAQSLRAALPPAPPTRVTLAIGPEGGFRADELELLRARFVSISLGPRVLRIETAAPAVLAGLRALWPEPGPDSDPARD